MTGATTGRPIHSTPVSIARADKLLLGVVIASVALGCLLILQFGFGRDQGIYAVVADSILHGGMPYRDVWDFKPPGIFYVYAVAELVFGHRMIAPRILEVVGLLSLYFAFRTIGLELFGSRLAGLLGWMLAVVAEAAQDFWDTGQPESYGAILAVWALAITINPAPRFGRSSSWGAMGFLFGFCFLLKPTIALGAIPCALYASWREYEATGDVRRGLLAIVIASFASVVPIAACAGWFVIRGAWPALYATLFEFAPAYTAISLSHFHRSKLYVAAVLALRCAARLEGKFLLVLCGGLLLPPRVMRSSAGLALVVAMIVLELLGVAVQAKFFSYHYSPVLMLMAVPAGGGLAQLWHRFGSVSALVLAIAAVAVYNCVSVPIIGQVGIDHAGLLANFEGRSVLRIDLLISRLTGRPPLALTAELDEAGESSLAINQAAAKEIAQIAAPSDRVYIWGFEPVIYWLAERRPASRFIYNVPQRFEWGRGAARAELIDSLVTAKPTVIVVESGDSFEWVTGNSLDSVHALADFPALADYIRANYAPADRLGNLQLYRRSGSAGAMPASSTVHDERDHHAKSADP